MKPDLKLNAAAGLAGAAMATALQLLAVYALFTMQGFTLA
jgi:hypothetical protein